MQNTQIFCQACGRKCSSGACFCAACGTKLEIVTDSLFSAQADNALPPDNCNWNASTSNMHASMQPNPTFAPRSAKARRFVGLVIAGSIVMAFALLFIFVAIGTRSSGPTQLVDLQDTTTIEVTIFNTPSMRNEFITLEHSAVFWVSEYAILNDAARVAFNQLEYGDIVLITITTRNFIYINLPRFVQAVELQIDDTHITSVDMHNQHRYDLWLEEITAFSIMAAIFGTIGLSLLIPYVVLNVRRRKILKEIAAQS